LFALAGLATGVITPSRDMMVLAITPPGAVGRVFAFVTNGFSIAGLITPLLFGWLLDHGSPRAVYLISGAFCLAAIPLVLMSRGYQKK
jgi:MFS family permease